MTISASGIVWRPRPELVEQANFTAFLARTGCASYDDLLVRDARDVRPFYDAIVAALGIEWDRPYESLLDIERGTPFARWFVGAEFNAAANALDRRIAKGEGGRVALVAEDENGTTRSLTLAELRSEVARLANALRALGVGKGDRVGIFMSLAAETAIALLAIGYVGAVAVPAFSGYGESALATRLGDSGARVLLATASSSRRGKRIDMLGIARAAVAASPAIEHVVVLGLAAAGSSSASAKERDWAALVAAQSTTCAYERTSANDPYLLLYTSGSTGKPKGVVHVHGGFPIKVMIDQHLCFDVKPGDRMLWFTDMGWMMGPFLVLGALGLGASIVLYDGTPDFPAADRLWDVCSRHQVTHLGIAPTAIRSLMTHGDDHPRRHDLSALRILGSSGEAWNTEPYVWFLEHVGGGRAPIINYSGGTEIGGGIIGCFPTMPLAPNSFHGPIPGMVADVVDPSGHPVRGDVGELAIRAPFVGMTQSFWRDATSRDDERYLDAYWRRIDGMWIHGDWAVVEPGTGGEPSFWYIRGRSDDTINVAGKRVGPAEFESALVSDPDVREAAAIAVPDDIKGDVVVCLVVARSRELEGEALRARLFGIVDSTMGKSLRPKAIRFVDDLPKTRNLKVMRRVARARYLGLTDLGDLSALENHAALAAIDAAR